MVKIKENTVSYSERDILSIIDYINEIQYHLLFILNEQEYEW